MSDRWFGLVEIVLFYGLVLAGLTWQLVRIKRSIAADKKRAAERADEEPGPKS